MSSIQNAGRFRQAIVTKFIPPGEVRCARVKARVDAGSVTIPWDHSQGIQENHSRAAMALVERYNWGGAWAGGCVFNQGYVFVQVTNDKT